jgi:hypothetical protein
LRQKKKNVPKKLSERKRESEREMKKQKSLLEKKSCYERPSVQHTLPEKNLQHLTEFEKRTEQKIRISSITK